MSFFPMRIVTVLALAAALSIYGPIGCGGTGDLTPEEHIARAKDYQDNGELRNAVIELKNALQQASDNTEARWLLGNVYLDVGDGAAAEKELRRAVELGMVQESAVIPLARALLLQGKYRQVIYGPVKPRSLQEANRAELLALHGNAYLGLSELDKAAKSFDAALEASPSNPNAGTGKARITAARNQLDQAREWLSPVIEQNPEYAPAWGLLGDIEAAEGRFEASEDAYSKAVELQNFVTLDRVKRARVRLELGNRAGAGDDVQFVRKAGIVDPLLSYVEGVYHFANAEYDAAENAFNASLQLDPTSLQAKMYLAITYFVQGQTERALHLTEQLSAKLPDTASVQRLRAAIHIRRSEFAQAQVELEKTLSRSSEDALALLLLGSVAVAEGRAAEGVNHFEKVATLQPDSDLAQKMIRIAKLVDGQDLGLGKLPGGISEPDEELDEQAFLLALSEFKQGNYQQALERARALHQGNPDQVDPINLMAACYLAMGQWDQGRKTLEKALVIAPMDPTATKNLAKVELRVENTQRAAELLEGFLMQHPGDREAVTLMVEVQSRLSNPEKAIAILENAVEHNPDDPSLRLMLASRYYDARRLSEVMLLTHALTEEQIQEQPNLLQIRGKAAMLSGETLAAQRSFERLVKVTPDSARAHYFFGDSLAAAGDAKGALEQIERAVQIDPSYLTARLTQITLLAKLGQQDRAQSAMTEVKREFGDRPEVLGAEGWLALLNGDYAIAAESLSQAVEKVPSTRTASQLVAALWAQGQHEEAIAFMQEWLKDHPKDLLMLMQLAGSYLTLEREADARSTYARVVEAYPNYVPALNNLAWLSRNEDIEEAIAYAEKAHELKPNDPQIADTLGMLLVKKGEVARGYRLIQNAAAQSPEDPEIQLHLAGALVQQQKFAEARVVLNELIAKAPAAAHISAEADALLASMPDE